MELSTVRLLAEINRRFYEEHAENFADSRPRLQAGVRRVLDSIGAGARVLEVGCGDGKVARALEGVAYTGVDQSVALLERAGEYMTKDERRRTKERASSTTFVQGDLLVHNLSDLLPRGPIDYVLAFAVFHHLPSLAARERVLAQLAGRLTPGGTFVMSNWQFHTSARILGRRAPWSAIGLTEGDVEPGDALLTWERKGRHGLRYVHAIDRAEAGRLMAAAGLMIGETFVSDGVSGDLAEYVVAHRSASPNA